MGHVNQQGLYFWQWVNQKDILVKPNLIKGNIHTLCHYFSINCEQSKTIFVSKTIQVGHPVRNHIIDRSYFY